MGKSPGHQKWPEHKIHERHLDRRIRVEINGEIVAESSAVIQVEEEGYPGRYYFPRSDVQMAKLERSQTTTQCPFKGTARHFSLKGGGETLQDIAWTYEDPYDEHHDLKDRLAFYDEKAPRIEISNAPG